MEEKKEVTKVNYAVKKETVIKLLQFVKEQEKEEKKNV